MCIIFPKEFLNLFALCSDHYANYSSFNFLVKLSLGFTAKSFISKAYQFSRKILCFIKSSWIQLRKNSGKILNAKLKNYFIPRF